MLKNMSALIPVLCGLILTLAGCKKTATVESLPDSQASVPANFDACTLITKEEIQAVMGSPIKDTKASANSGQGYRISQCFYAAEEFSRSVSLAVTQADPNSSAKRSVKDYWAATFGRVEGKEKENEKESEADREKRESLGKQKRDEGEEEEGVPPKRIDGIGDAAYWMGNRVGGALYVLKKAASIRISVGGADTQEAKIDKSKALAQKALDRL